MTARPSAETNVPGPLDVVLRDLHLLWCDDPHTDPSWHLPDADPVEAARTLAHALWRMADAASDGDPVAGAAVELVGSFVAAEGEQ